MSMNYRKHMWLNVKVAAKCGKLFWMHLFHAAIPIQLTSHESLPKEESITAPPITPDIRWPPTGKVMICDKGRSVDMPLHVDCTWGDGVKCAGLKLHRYDENCQRRFCGRTGVWCQCREALEETREWKEWKKSVDDYFGKTPQKEWTTGDKKEAG